MGQDLILTTVQDQQQSAVQDKTMDASPTALCLFVNNEAGIGTGTPPEFNMSYTSGPTTTDTFGKIYFSDVAAHQWGVNFNGAHTVINGVIPGFWTKSFDNQFQIRQIGPSFIMTGTVAWHSLVSPGVYSPATSTFYVVGDSLPFGSLWLPNPTADGISSFWIGLMPAQLPAVNFTPSDLGLVEIIP